MTVSGMGGAGDVYEARRINVQKAEQQRQVGSPYGIDEQRRHEAMRLAVELDRRKISPGDSGFINPKQAIQNTDQIEKYLRDGITK